MSGLNRALTQLTGSDHALNFIPHVGSALGLIVLKRLIALGFSMRDAVYTEIDSVT